MYRMLISDPAFRELDIPLNPAQRRDLDKRISKGTPTEPIPVWQNYILTGHERYDLCEKYHRFYRIRDMQFSRKYEAVAWVCREQLKRQELCRPAVCWLICRLYLALQNAENRKAAKDQFQYKQLSPSSRYESSPSEEAENRELMQKIGDEYGYHKATIRNYVRFGKQLDRLEEMFPGIRIRVLKGEVEVAIMFMDALLQMPRDQLEKMVTDPNCRKLQPPDEAMNRIRKVRDPWFRRKVHVDTGIKETPAYDPDAELDGLTWTIGAWVKAILRTGEKADLQQATESGKERLRQALETLGTAIDHLNRILEEDEDD